jgi:hypothetical protein
MCIVKDQLETEDLNATRKNTLEVFQTYHDCRPNHTPYECDNTESFLSHTNRNCSITCRALYAASVNRWNMKEASIFPLYEVCSYEPSIRRTRPWCVPTITIWSELEFSIGKRGSTSLRGIFSKFESSIGNVPVPIEDGSSLFVEIISHWTLPFLSIFAMGHCRYRMAH